MKTLHLYVLRQALSTLAMTICVFTLILLLVNILKEILGLLVNRQATVFLIVKAIALLLPWILAFALPFALLAAMLLLFGRLSADNELTAIKASGISLLALIMPLLLLGAMTSGVCAWFNMKLTPDARVIYKKLVYDLTLQSADLILTEDRFIDEIPRVILYFRKRHGDTLEDLSLYNLDENNHIVSRISAPAARIIWGPNHQTIAFEFDHALSEQLLWRAQDIHGFGPAIPATNFFGTNIVQTVLSNTLPGPVVGKSKIPEWQPMSTGVTTDPIDLSKINQSARLPKISEMSFSELRGELGKRRGQGITVTPVLVEMHRQVAFSFASFAFTMVAIPLGIRAHRRETSIGMVISLLLAAFYYSFLILGQALQTREHLHPHLIIWIPNILFQTLGVILLWRANRAG